MLQWENLVTQQARLPESWSRSECPGVIDKSTCGDKLREAHKPTMREAYNAGGLQAYNAGGLQCGRPTSLQCGRPTMREAICRWFVQIQSTFLEPRT